VDVKYDNLKREGPATVTFTVNGQQLGEGRIERTVPATFTVSETFDVGRDLRSPVSRDYHKRAPFPFNGKLDRIHMRYLGKSGEKQQFHL
jgi:hypothetical protein